MANHTVINDITNYAEAGPNSLDGVSTQKFRVSDSTLKLLQWLSHYYDNMSELRKKWKRAQDFVMGRQLEEKIEWNGRKITIREYMELQGMPILEYDVISDKLISLVGWFASRGLLQVVLPWIRTRRTISVSSMSI